ncbi:MAG: hypothetical protein ACFE9L_22045 [Candidatus Hodarchaeota archaeon]
MKSTAKVIRIRSISIEFCNSSEFKIPLRFIDWTVSISSQALISSFTAA